jgi:hypothetical protein
VKVRNLVLVSDEEGNGYVSASLVSPTRDTLVTVSGNPVKLDGSAGAPLTVVQGGTPVSLTPNKLVVLTDPTAALTVSSPDLRPGLVATVTLQFASGEQQSIQAPVLSPTDPIYATVSPAPSTEATPSPVRHHFGDPPLKRRRRLPAPRRRPRRPRRRPPDRPRPRRREPRPLASPDPTDQPSNL